MIAWIFTRLYDFLQTAEAHDARLGVLLTDERGVDE